MRRREGIRRLRAADRRLVHHRAWPTAVSVMPGQFLGICLLSALLLGHQMRLPGAVAR